MPSIIYSYPRFSFLLTPTAMTAFVPFTPLPISNFSHSKTFITSLSKCPHPQTKLNHHQPIRACVSEQEPTITRSSFPKLYDAWFGPDHQISNQMRGAIEQAYSAGIRSMELQWPVVPNLEEIAAGTLLNFEFGKQVAADLGMSAQADYPLIKRYLASFCNLYWVKNLAQATPFRDRTVWAVSCDGVSKTRAEDNIKNVRLTSMRNMSEEPGENDVVVIVDPRGNDAWKKGMKLRPKGSDGVIIFLNSQFNESYGLVGPRRGPLKDIEAVYFLKRLTRGYAFFSYPGPWRACLEKPDLSIEELKDFEKEPKLREIATVVREESNKRYGGFFNDRYVRGFGGRL